MGGLAGPSSVDLDREGGSAGQPSVHRDVVVTWSSVRAMIPCVMSSVVPIRTSSSTMLAVSGGGLMVTGSVSVGAEYFAIPLTGLVVADPALRSMIQPYGVRFDRAGNVHFRVSGTVANPVLR